MKAYVYRAALHCESCGEAIKTRLDATRAPHIDPDNESSYDSDEYPKGPYDNGGGEADYAAHCDSCGVALDNPVIGSDGERTDRQGVLDSYDVDSRGIITSPGKFEGEAVYVPHFWDVTMDGSCETLGWPYGAETYLVDIDDSDRAAWPELPTDCVALHFQESESGFVSCETLNAGELEALHAECEAEAEAERDECSDPHTAAERWHSGQSSGLYRYQCHASIPDRDTAEDALSEAESILETHPDCDEADGLRALIDDCNAYLEAHPAPDEEESNDC